MKKLNKIEIEILEWSRKFPIDRWWREKHKVAFMSKIHRETSFLDQIFEYYEDKIVFEAKNIKEYVPNQGDFLNTEVLDEKSQIKNMQQEFEEEFKDVLDGS